MHSSTYKHFIIRLFLFLIPVFIFLAFTELKLRSYSNLYDQKKIHIEKNLNKIEMLILGNSQALSGLDPRKFRVHTFNFAHDNQTLLYDMLTTEKYLKELTNLKVVIVPISYFSLYHMLHIGAGNPRQYNYYFSYDLPLREVKFLDIRRMSYIAAYSPRIAFGIVYLGKYRSLPLRDDGFAPRTGSFDTTDARKLAIGLMARHNEIIKLGDYKTNMKMLEHFLGCLKKRNIKVVFTSIPVSSFYRNLENEKVLTTNLLAIDSLDQKYGSIYIDIGSTVQLSDKYFSDIDHLNEEGAEIVTSKLDSAMNTRMIFSKR